MKRSFNEENKTFVLTTVTYGIINKPFQAMRKVLQLPKDDGSKSLLASLVLKNDRSVYGRFFMFFIYI